MSAPAPGPIDAGWLDVDRSAEPGLFLAALDDAAALGPALDGPDGLWAWLEPAPGQRILEVGCGLGRLARALAPRLLPGGELCALDLSETVVEAARARGAAPGLRLARGDVHELHLPDGRFDRCLAIDLVERSPDPGRALGELARVCAPGGRVVLAELAWETLALEGLARAPAERLRAHLASLRPEAPGGLRARLEAAGLEAEELAEQRLEPGADPGARRSWLAPLLRAAVDAGALSPEEAAPLGARPDGPAGGAAPRWSLVRRLLRGRRR